jgi:hypothetical protein
MLQILKNVGKRSSERGVNVLTLEVNDVLTVHVLAVFVCVMASRVTVLSPSSCRSGAPLSSW